MKFKLIKGKARQAIKLYAIFTHMQSIIQLALIKIDSIGRQCRMEYLYAFHHSIASQCLHSIWFGLLIQAETYGIESYKRVVMRTNVRNYYASSIVS